MTKKEMLKEMCDCEITKANTDLVKQWYNEYKRLEKRNFIDVKSIKGWKSWARYMLKAK